MWKEAGSKDGLDISLFFNIMIQILGNKGSSFNETSEEVLEAFRVFDKNGEGFISAHEMKSVMCNLGEQMNDAEVDIMLKAAEIDEHGQFNYVDFVK